MTITLIVLCVFLYVMGGWNMYSDVLASPRGPSPKGMGYSKDLQKFYDESPSQRRAVIDTFTIFATVTIWPIVAAFAMGTYIYWLLIGKKNIAP